LKEKLEQLPPKGQEKFRDYVEEISGEKETQLEIVDTLKEALPQFKENLLQAREKILEQIQKRIQTKEQSQTNTCPQTEEPAASFCQEGRITIEKDEQGCIIKFKCATSAQVEVPPAQSTSPQPVPKQEQEQTGETTSSVKNMLQQQLQQFKELLPGTNNSQ